MRPNSRYDNSSRPSVGTPGKLVVAIVQPQSIQLRSNRDGQTYATVRADIAFGNRTLERTVMVYAQSYPKFASVLAPRRPIQVALSRAVASDEKGNMGGEYLIARKVISVLDTPMPIKSRKTADVPADHDPQAEASVRSVTPHVRSGYHRRQRYGKGGKLVKIVWIHACEVGAAKTSAKAKPAASTRAAQPHRGNSQPRRAGRTASRPNRSSRASAPAGWA